MEKDAFYFPHFCNARHDRKIKRLRKELGIEGYGIFFMLLETLREQADYKYPIADIDLLADEYGTSEQKVRTVLSNYELFQHDENDHFFSSNLIMYLTPYLEGKERRRIAGLKGNLIRYGYYTKEELEGKTPDQIQLFADQISHSSHSDRIPIADARKGKERKGKEIKESKVNEIEFDQFWTVYPKKEGKKACRAKYETLCKKNILPEITEHIKIIEAWKLTRKWQEGYVPNPQTWLNGERWNDELPQDRKGEIKQDPTEIDYAAGWPGHNN